VELMPTDAYEQEKSSEGRVSSFFGLKTLKPVSHTVHLPPVYQEFLSFMYEEFDQPRQLETAREKPAHGLLSDISGEIYQDAGVTRITVRRLGQDFPSALGAWEAKAAHQEVVAYQIWLSLAEPWVGWAVDRLRERGYFLGGVLPRWFDNDGLLMQRLVNPPDWDAMQILLDRSREIAGYIKEDWQKVAG
jgi:hypothetical protein